MPTVGVVGARGHTGGEWIRLVGGHPSLSLGFVTSRSDAGRPVPGADGAVYVDPTPDEAARRGVDAVLLALPNGASEPWIDAFERLAPDTVIVDLSADRRFSEDWVYGLPEHGRDRLRGARRIANPGCYATAFQLALRPVLRWLDGPAQGFGVSGYSGAGTAPSERNDPAALRDNLLPYSLVGHLHEREVAHHLGHAVEFLPCVAPHFRGLVVTANAHLRRAVTEDEVRGALSAAYDDEPLVRVVDAPPWVSRVAGTCRAEVGGVAVSADGRRVVIVAALDNLLKGAASQAMQNLNLALGLGERDGISVDP